MSTNENEFLPSRARRKKSFMRLNISSPSGAGKTMGALLIAKGLVSDWSKITIIDTEAGSASLYEHLGEFNAIDLTPPYTPERYIKAIEAALKGNPAEGVTPAECVIIDSSTHEWSGSGGCIEANETLAQQKYRGNTWSAWNETTPRHDEFINKIQQTKVHFITCTRSKTETIMGDDKKVKKVGLKDIQREGWEFELTISLNVDRDTHTAIASKDRTELFEGKAPFTITEETGKLIKDWCELGIDVDALAKEKLNVAIVDAKQKLTVCINLPQLQVAFTGLSKDLQLACVDTKDLMKAILSLANLKTIDDLEVSTKGLSTVILQDASFVDALGKRREVIMASNTNS